MLDGVSYLDVSALSAILASETMHACSLQNQFPPLNMPHPIFLGGCAGSSLARTKMNGAKAYCVARKGFTMMSKYGEGMLYWVETKVAGSHSMLGLLLSP